MEPLLDRLQKSHALSLDEWEALIRNKEKIDREVLYREADRVRRKTYGDKIFLRGLIEFSNYCKNDCLYCGIRRSNENIERYRLSKNEILNCCRLGHNLGYKTFVLQSGEDFYYDTDKISDIIRSIKKEFPDCAVTLSLGERDKKTYEAWFDAGADRYLLRHETADKAHYRKLHPPELGLDSRLKALEDLKATGYQVGTGFIVGSPYQEASTLAKDLYFIQSFRPHMIGIGPFIPQSDTPFRNKEPGTLEDTLFFVALLRLLLPEALIPATTALGTIHPLGREMGIKAGANVLMPNLSPGEVRDKYLLYDNKICTGDEAAECRNCLENRIGKIGYKIVNERGDSLIPTTV